MEVPTRGGALVILFVGVGPLRVLLLGDQNTKHSVECGPLWTCGQSWFI